MGCIDTCYNMVMSTLYYAKSKKPDTKDNSQSQSIIAKLWDLLMYRHNMHMGVVQARWEEENGSKCWVWGGVAFRLQWKCFEVRQWWMSIHHHEDLKENELYIFYVNE